MKQIFKLILLIGICCAAVSCHTYSEEILLLGTPIELSQDQVHFKEGGGEVTIYCLNYPVWHISQFQEWGRQEGEETIDYPVSYSGDGNHQEVLGDGITLTVYNDDPSQTDGYASVRIIVDPCATHRSWKLRMRSGDTFTTIRISQN